MVRLTDHPDMTLDVYRGHKTTIQQQYKKCQVICCIKHPVGIAFYKRWLVEPKEKYISHCHNTCTCDKQCEDECMYL